MKSYPFLSARFIGSTLLLAIITKTNGQENPFPVLHGPYMGQAVPGMEAKVFAAGIVSSDSLEHSRPAISPDGKTIVWTVIHRWSSCFLLESDYKNGQWTKPALTSFAAKTADDFYPSFSLDGKQLFFSSRRELPSGLPVVDMRIWKVERSENGWGEPTPLDTVISKGNEYAHSVSNNGTIYFSARKITPAYPRGSWDIYCSRMVNGNYQEPERLDTAINDGSYVDGPLISPDESFLIFESNRNGGNIDLYICFKNEDGKWSPPRNMGPDINTESMERFAGLSPDGKYLFFGSNRGNPMMLADIYWIDARVIDKLR